MKELLNSVDRKLMLYLLDAERTSSCEDKDDVDLVKDAGLSIEESAYVTDRINEYIGTRTYNSNETVVTTDRLVAILQKRLEPPKAERKVYMTWVGPTGAVFVKDLDFFTEQQGFTQEWGKRWTPVVATSLEEARELRRETVQAGTLPMQPIILDERGILRFRTNRVVRYLLDHGPTDLNRIALMEDIPQDEKTQFMQLIGVSLQLLDDMHEIPREACDAAHAEAQRLGLEAR